MISLRKHRFNNLDNKICVMFRPIIHYMVLKSIRPTGGTDRHTVSAWHWPQVFSTTSTLSSSFPVRCKRSSTPPVLNETSIPAPNFLPIELGCIITDPIRLQLHFVSEQNNSFLFLWHVVDIFGVYYPFLDIAFHLMHNKKFILFQQSSRAVTTSPRLHAMLSNTLSMTRNTDIHFGYPTSFQLSHHHL